MNIKLKLFFYLILMSVSGLSFGADVTPPQLESWELSPASINVDGGFCSAKCPVILDPSLDSKNGK